MRFTEKLQQRIKSSGSRLCVGLDPRPGEHGAGHAKDFLTRVIEETSVWAAAFKPNMAYFEAMGIEGMTPAAATLPARARTARCAA